MNEVGLSLFTSLSRLLSRFRYPHSLPEDVAKDIGIPISNRLNHRDFFSFLSSLHDQPTKLRKYMPRREAEALFTSALKKEYFKTNSLFSYDFYRGWLIFALYFDESNRLRRVHVHCPSEAHQLQGYDMVLDN